METLHKYAGTVALVILAIFGLMNLSSQKMSLFGSATACTDGYTCFTNLETQGNSIVDGTSSFVGASTFTGAITAGVLTTTGIFTQGGGIFASSTVNSTATLLATDFDTENWIDYTANVSSVTITLPASTTFPLSTTAGACRQFGIRNATTTAAITLTISGGTGSLLKGVSTSTASTVSFKTILGDTDGSNFALFNACRKTNSDIMVSMIPYND